MPKDLTRVCVQVIYCVVFLQGKTEFGEIKVKKEKKGGGYKKKSTNLPTNRIGLGQAFKVAPVYLV